MNQPSPSQTVPPELLERDSLLALLDVLRAARHADVTVDLTGRSRLPTPVVQILLAAVRDGVRLRLERASPGVAAGLRALGVEAILPVEGVTP